MNKKFIKTIIKLFIVICIIGIVYSTINIVLWYVGTKKNSAIQKEVKEIISESNMGDIKEESLIDFTKLKVKNSEIVGYLKVNGTSIDYIVVKGNNNKFYLNHNLYREYSLPGWIFMDYRNKLDGNDRNIIIYGHNTKDSSMFGTLNKVVTKEWYENENNHIIKLVLENEILTYQVFSTYSIKVEDYYITTNFKNDTEFNKFIHTLKGRSVYDYGVEVDDTESILTLSTCTGNGKSRMVLHAKLLNVID